MQLLQETFLLHTLLRQQHSVLLRQHRSSFLHSWPLLRQQVQSAGCLVLLLLLLLLLLRRRRRRRRQLLVLHS